MEQIARRVLGSAHPTIIWMERSLRDARAALRARETPPPPEPTRSDETPVSPSLADVVSQFGKAVSDGKYRA